ncbi:MAG: Alpha-acetolactate decarboxylase [Methanomassiliicoccales archaeon PtaU1.Bin124]|nr:MAG: Alpha-acetolactate decarboxylase [Methanomassiliicoccales archaeon PtaU1.Bin124]
MDLKKVIIAIILVAMVLLAALLVVFGPKANLAEEKDQVFQVGTLQDLLEGKYQGKMTVSDLLSHGSMGLGTFEGINGEMIVLDGACYQALNDGTMVRVDGAVKTPFASVSDLGVDATTGVTMVVNYTVLQQQLLASMNDTDVFVLIVIHANFTSMTVRSVPGQIEPYPPLPMVLENQSVYGLANVSGTLVGFYSPSYIGTIDSAGFHLHFISDDRKSGGHVLDMSVNDAVAQFDYKEGLELEF